MLTKNKKFSVAIITIMIAVMALMATMLCLVDVAKADEAVTLAVDNSVTTAYVPVAGTFKDGKREYGGFYMGFEANKINSTQYKITMDISLITTDYLSDNYYIELFDYYFYGTNVSFSKTDEFSVRLAQGIKDYDLNRVSSISDGICGKTIPFKSPYNVTNNYPYIKHTITINVTGKNPVISIALKKIHVIGKFLAKDTKVNSEFVYLDLPLTLNQGKLIPKFRYMSEYGSETFITNGRYTTAGGSVPDYWEIDNFVKRL